MEVLTVEEIEVAALAAKEKLEKIALRLTVAFSIWALVVVVFGAGILRAQGQITESIDKFRAEFVSYVVASEARLTRLEEIDKAARQERINNLERIRELEQRLRER